MSEIAPIPRHDIRTPQTKSAAPVGVGACGYPHVCSPPLATVSREEVVPGVIARPVGPCDVEWFEQRLYTDPSKSLARSTHSSFGS